MACRSEVVVFLIVMMGLCGVCLGAVYKVGDSTGWTTLGKPDYAKWASGKKFHVGDTILFEYHKQIHNVMQVSQADYESCNASSPILSYATGHDSITLKRPGQYYYLCGVPGHCKSGQKVAIKVAQGSEGPAMSPGPASSVSSTSPSGSPPEVASPGPSPNGAVVLVGFPNLWLALSSAVLCVGGFVF